MFPASLLLAGSIFTSYADTRRASAHPAPSAAPADSMASRQAALPAQSAISLLAAAVDTTDLEEVELPFRTIVEEVPDVDPVAWADTALFHFHNPATDSRYLRLTDDDYRTIAEELGVETAAIKAVVDIEAGPSHKGFWKPGKPLINFDLSMFQQFARRRGVSLEKARKSSPVIFRKPDRAKYGSYQGAQYARLEAAAKICKPLGVESCFWGMFQIGGFNWRKCGCDNIEEFVALMSRSERATAWSNLSGSISGLNLLCATTGPRPRRAATIRVWLRPTANIKIRRRADSAPPFVVNSLLVVNSHRIVD